MQAAVIKRIGYKVKRKLRVVRALVPMPRPSDERFIRELGDNAGELLTDFPLIFDGLQDPAAKRKLSQDRSGDVDRARETARRAQLHNFDLLGSGWIDLGPQIDWSLDFKSGKRWDKRDHRLQKLVDLSDNSDVKVPWELSRCQHFLPMAITHFMTGDEALATEFENQVNSWIIDNEYHQSVNWSCAMDVAIRCLNWLTAYQIFSLNHRFEERFQARLALELYKGGRSIWENRENTGAGYNTNHYLADLIGLLYLGWMFRSVPQAREWFGFAQRELEQEMQLQVHTDGIDYESSLPYHGLVTEFFFYAQHLCARIDRGFSQQYCDRLARMVSNLARFTGADGLVENFGDNDDGRLFRILWRGSRDYRDLLSMSGPAAIPQCEEPTIERVLLKSQRQAHAEATPTNPALESVLLSATGICQLRSDDIVLNFFANGVGTAGLGNHKHNDLLSFTLEYRGSRVFVDPGSYVYTVEEAARNQFRSTRNHNTVTIDGQEQNRMVPGLLFHLRPDGKPRLVDWRSQPDHDLVVAEHDCYSRLDEPVIHRRAILLRRSTSAVVIRDTLLGAGGHEIEFNFHLERLAIVMTSAGAVLLRTDPSRPGLLFEEIDANRTLTLDTSWISPSYGVKYPSLRLSKRVIPELPYETTFVIIPEDSLERESAQALVSKLSDLTS